MKSSEKKGILILILVAVLIMVAIWMFTNQKNGGANNNGGSTQISQVDASQGEFTKVEQDGTVVNTSEKLKENKVESGYEITNISYAEKDGETVLKADVTNMTGKEQGAFMADIVLLDKEGKELGKIPVSITDMVAGETIGIQAGITEKYANAYDFKIEKR